MPQPKNIPYHVPCQTAALTHGINKHVIPVIYRVRKTRSKFYKKISSKQLIQDACNYFVAGNGSAIFLTFG